MEQNEKSVHAYRPENQKTSNESKNQLHLKTDYYW